MRLWVTRTRPHADATADRIRALGHEAVVEPLLEVRFLSPAIDLAGVGALAFTSGNGVEGFARLSEKRDLPVFTVGAASAAAARSSGFTDIHSAEGDSRSLAEVIATTSPKGQILWPSPAEPAADLTDLLSDLRVTARKVTVYETVQLAPAIPTEIDGLIVHSARAAKAAAGLIDESLAPSLTLLAISEAAAAPLAHLPFARVAVAPRPDETSLLSLLAA